MKATKLKWPVGYELWTACGEFTDSGREEYGWEGNGKCSKSLFKSKKDALEDCINTLKQNLEEL